MSYVIELIGIILIAASPAPGLPYRALVPAWTAEATYCGQRVTVPRHEAYFRIDNRDINAATIWPASERIDCEPTENCTLFRLPAGSIVTLDSGFAPGNAVHEHPSYCLVPQFRREINHEIREVDERGAAVVMALPGGDLTARRASTGAIIARLLVPAPPESVLSPRPVTATVTSHGAVHRLVLNPGGTLRLVNSTPDMAGRSESAIDPHASEHPHFLIYNALLPESTQICRPAPMARPCGDVSGEFAIAGGVIGDFLCSVGGCCR